MRDERDGLTATTHLPSTESVELKHLRSFIAVADELNFGRAAGRLHLSQPALSRQIRALERYLGCTLFDRSTHGVTLTIAGEALIGHASEILKAVRTAIDSTRSVDGELSGIASRLWSPVTATTFSATAAADVTAMRSAYEDFCARPHIPEGIQVAADNCGGVPGLRVGPDVSKAPTVVFVHGGGAVIGSAYGYRALAGAIALASDACVLLPDYRLAPEHPFPAAINDVTATYAGLLDRGVDHQKVTMMGDSAGGGLALSSMLAAKAQRLPLPGAAALLCPGFVRVPDEEHERGAGGPVRTYFVELYLNANPPDHPLVDLVHADLSGLPPMLIQGARGDMLFDEVEQIAERARHCGVDVEVDLYPLDAHVFHMFFDFLPEARAAIARLGVLHKRHGNNGVGGP